MTVDLDKLAPEEALKQLDAWEAKLPGSMYTHEFIAELAGEAIPALIAVARSRYWERVEALEDPTDLDKLEQLARAATAGPWTQMFIGFVGTIHDPTNGRDSAYAAAACNAVPGLIKRVRAAEAENTQLKSAGLSLNETIAKSAPRLQDAIDRMHRAEAIVRDLAAADPVIREHIVNDDGTKSGRDHCSLCVSDGGWGSDVYHEPECPWRRAVEAKS